MSRLRTAELFAGAGGMVLGLHRAGCDTVWLAEIADFPRRVLQARFPDVPLYGDVTELDGTAMVAKHGALDLIAGGSPCQDLSVAGKRKGLAGARSGLFHHQMRLWTETGADLCLWENVAGALSSHHGQDFAAVLSAFVGAAVAVPRDGWAAERCSGVVSGPTGVAAWRLLDAQYFGVPQRRLRVFVLGTRAGRVDPAEVLLEPEGVRWDSPQSREAGEITPALPAIGAGTSRTGNERTESGLTVLGFHVCGDGSDYGADCSPTVRAQNESYGGRPPAVIAFREKMGAVSSGMVKPSLMSDTGETGNMLPSVVTVLGDVTHALTHDGHDASEDGTGRGTPIVAFSLGSHSGADDADVSNRSHASGGPTGFGINEEMANSLRAGRTQGVVHGIPRRLMPIECERLMGWPDGWTDVPDENGKPASDSARYKACGNGVVSNVAQWIGERIVRAVA